MSSRVRAVAGTKSVGFLLFMSILLDWPDNRYAGRFMTGLRVSGDIERSRLHPAGGKTGALRSAIDTFFGYVVEHLDARKAVGAEAKPPCAGVL